METEQKKNGIKRDNYLTMWSLRQNDIEFHDKTFTLPIQCVAAVEVRVI